jgi:hypothetical protein
MSLMLIILVMPDALDVRNVLDEFNISVMSVMSIMFPT